MHPGPISSLIRSAFPRRRPWGTVAGAVAAGIFLAGSFSLPNTRAADAGVESLLSRLPDPESMTKSPLERALKDPDPMFKDAAFRQFVVAVQRSDANGALRALRPLTERFPKKAGLHYLRGFFATALRLFPEAESAFRTGLAIQPAAEGWHGLAQCQSLQGHRGQAIESERRAVRLKPDFAPGWSSLAVFQVREGRPGEGAESARQLTRIAPKNPVGWGVLGFALASQNKFNDAIPAFQRATQLAPNYLFAQEGLGFCLLTANRPMEAVAPLRRVVQQAPRGFVARTQLGYCLLRTGKPAEGADLCREAVKLKPDFGPGWDALGLCLRQQGKTREAIGAFERAVKLSRDNALPRRHLEETQRAGVAAGR